MNRSPARFPFAPLWSQAVAAELTMVALARQSGIPHRQLYRYRDEGFTMQAADRAAHALDLHPAEVWPEWNHVADDDDDETEGEAA